MIYLVAYIAALVVYLALDLAWRAGVETPRLRRHLGDAVRPDLRPGIRMGFQVLYAVGLLYLAVLPAMAVASWIPALINGAVLGVIASGCREAGNMAVLRGWRWSTVLLEVLWGMVLSALAALAAYYAATVWAIWTV